MSLRSQIVDLVDELEAYEAESLAGAVAVVGLAPLADSI